MIDQPTIDRILDAAQIVDVVSDFVTLRKRGVNYVQLCRSTTIRPRRSTYRQPRDCANALLCGKGGNVVHFIMEHEQMSYPEALKYLAKKYGIEVKERSCPMKKSSFRANAKAFSSSISLPATISRISCITM